MEPIVYALLILTSVVGLAFIVERGFMLRWRRVVPPEIEAAVESCQSAEDVPMLRRVCQQHKSPAKRPAGLVVLNRHTHMLTEEKKTRAICLLYILLI